MRQTLVMMGIALLSFGAFDARAQGDAGGTISGRVFSAETGAPIDGVSVVLDFPESEDGTPSPQLVSESGIEGDYEFDAVPAGRYALTFVKAGYRASVVTDFEVIAGQDNVADFPMPPVQVNASGEILNLEAFSVSADVVGDLMNNLELRLESDQLVNVFSAEEFSKFGASDVADAIKRVAGVNVVEGQFAIIRGLEDRYSSTLYNGAPIPSPDPDSQSVQLDLFPSDVVNNLQVGKNFSPQSPSNSAGGSIDIVTHDYPEETTVKLTLGTGFNERTLDEFLRFDRGSPVGINTDGDRTIESDYSFLLGGRTEKWDREFRFKFVFANETDYQTAMGQQGESAPVLFQGLGPPGGPPVIVRQTGGLSLGRLDRRGPVFDLQESQRQEQTTYYVGAGVDLDREGMHRIDGSFFRTLKKDEVVQYRDNAFIPGFDYGALDADSASAGNFQAASDPYIKHWIFDWFDPQESRGGVASGAHAYYSPVYDSRTFDRERELSVYQLNGIHELDDFLSGLSVSWVANYAETSQTETTFNARYSFNTFENIVQAEEASTAPGPLPASPADFTGVGLFASRSDIVYSQNDIDENQYFGRIDLEYEFEPHRDIDGVFRTGYWFEQSNRTVESRFVLTPFGTPSRPGVLTRNSLGIAAAIPPNLYDPSIPIDTGAGAQPAIDHTVVGFDPVSMGRRIFYGSQIGEQLGEAPQSSRNKREISAWNGEIKLTLWEDVDVLAGIRIESLRIETINDPYLGTCGPGVEFVNGTCPPGSAPPDLFPGRRLFLDRIDNPGAPDFALPNRSNSPFNDEILGIPTPVDPNTGYFDCFTKECLDERLRGEINETFFLPAVGLSYRPIEGVALRFAYSQTVARPSFRELGYYASQESGSDDFFVGNPQLTYSEVESLDGRVEWTFGDLGDLFAVSAFHKIIQNPIEQVILLDLDNADCTGICTFRSFLNNQSDAELIGVELEGRKSLDFIQAEWLGGSLDTISLGGNFTYIDAEVDRSPVRIERSARFFGISQADIDAGLEEYSRYKPKRRLFGQPEWIANADVTFDHPDWGTKATLSLFAISEVLDTVGGIDANNVEGVTGFSLDRYIDEFYQLDFTASQTFEIPGLPGEWAVRGTVKNLTDTTRKVIYDQSQTVDDVRERSFKVGRDYSFSLGYTFVY